MDNNETITRLNAVNELAAKLGFYTETRHYSVCIFNKDEELFEYQSDTCKFIRKGYKTFVTKLNKYTYRAYIRKCLDRELQKLKRDNEFDLEANKERFTSRKYGNKAWAVYDNDRRVIVAYYNSANTASKLEKELKRLLDSKPDIIKTISSFPNNIGASELDLEVMAEEILVSLCLSVKDKMRYSHHPNSAN